MADSTNAHAHDNVVDLSRSEPDQSLRLRTKPTTTDQEISNTATQKQTDKTDSSHKAESSTGFQANPKDNAASTTNAPADNIQRYSCAPSTAAWESMTKEQRHVHIYTPTPSPPSSRSGSPSRSDVKDTKDTTTDTNATNSAANEHRPKYETQQQRIQTATLLGAERAKQVQMENIIYLLHGLMALCIIFGTAMVVCYPKFLGVVFAMVVLVMGVLLRGVWGWFSG